ncbi:MAG: N-acetylmuramoyl-L-alanine amidase [Prevotellaceae bacterium]|jgi:N-acetylmuramoyl-L-alanine amidase|nr:N-acetylmuramoyl-L-alanine amidase [Prevotellaceae bacterium]
MSKSVANIKKNIAFICFLAAFYGVNVTAKCQSVVTQTGISRIVIDAGHGGPDPGAVGKICKEKDLNLDVALQLGKFVEDSFPYIEVLYTRKTDVFIPLNERSDYANKHNADLFISIHANAAVNKNATGTETYVMGPHKEKSNMEVAMRENAVITYENDYSSKYEGYDPKSPESFIIFSLLQNAHLEQSLQIAARVQEELGNSPIKQNRGVKQAEFLVLWRTAMPSILVEMGYLSNEQEEKNLNKKETRKAIAYAIFRAFRNYKTFYEDGQTIAPHAPEQTTEVEQPTPQSRHYRVQIKASAKQIPLDASDFAGYENIAYIRMNDLFKYTVGNFTTLEAAAQYCRDVVRPKIADAFVICVEDEKIIPLNNKKKR